MSFINEAQTVIFKLLLFFSKGSSFLYRRLILKSPPTELAAAYMGKILAGSALTGVDIGGAVSLQPHWYSFVGNMDFVIFEPDAEACAKLRAKYDQLGFGKRCKIIPHALSGSGGKQILHITNQPTGSSLKPLNEKSPYLSEKNSYFYPIERLEISTLKLAEALDKYDIAHIDAIKLDIQGAELDVLKTLDDSRMKGLLIVELEVGLLDLYKESATFAEVHEFMQMKGFELFDVRTSRGYHQWGGGHGEPEAERLGIKLGDPSFSAKITEFDAVYFRTPFSFIENRDVKMLRKLIACYCTYRFFLEALRVVELACEAKLFTAAEAAIIIDGIRGIHLLGRSNTSVFGSFLRANHSQMWGQYMWVTYPSS